MALDVSNVFVRLDFGQCRTALNISFPLCGGGPGENPLDRHVLPAAVPTRRRHTALVEHPYVHPTFERITVTIPGGKRRVTVKTCPRCGSGAICKLHTRAVLSNFCKLSQT